MLPLLNRIDRLQLRGSKRAPAQRVDNVVLDGRVEALEFRHVSSMSSKEMAPAAARSFTVISASTSVSL